MPELTISRRAMMLLASCVLLLLPQSGFVAGESLPAGADAPGWLDAVRADMAEREYHVTWQDHTALPDLAAAYHAPNRAQGFRTYFTDSGIRVVPRTVAAPSWEWGLSWVAYGRGGTSWTVPAASLSAEDNRITYMRGAFEEFYENSARGLKQHFVLPFPPEESSTPGAATTVLRTPTGLPYIELSLSGDLSPMVAEDGRSVELATAGGARVVRARKLRAVDALGVEVSARIEGFSSGGIRGIRLVLGRHDIVYPVTVELLVAASPWTGQGEQAGAAFGYSVATAGDVNGDGYSDVIIGAPRYDSGDVDEGRAFVYHGSASGLATSPAWTADGNQAGAWFGSSVATAGDINRNGFSDVIVGAYLFDSSFVDEGRAYVYRGSAAGLATNPGWTAAGGQTNAWFGISVAGAGDVNGDGFSDVIVGASGYDNDQPDEGRTYLYRGVPAGLTTNPAWTAEGNQPGARFGDSVATAGDVNGDGYADVIVGALLYDNGEENEGRAMVYHGSASGPAASPAWMVEGDQANAQAGVSVATAGDVNGDGFADVIVGIYFFDHDQTDEGRADVYLGSSGGLATSAAWTVESDQQSALFGRSVASAGDINGDGYADVIVGAYQYDNPEVNEGRATLYLGSSAGLGMSAAGSIESHQNFSFTGFSVATAGDVNGDGYADVIVGAYLYDDGEQEEGAAFVHHGTAVGLAASSGWEVGSDQSSGFAASVATAGDVNGDGYADVIVGAERYDNGEIDEGRAFVYHGSGGGLATSPAWMAESDQTSARFGTSVATAGDVNGDGYADVIVGAHQYDNPEVSEGRVFVYHGSAAGLTTSFGWSADSNQIGANFGVSVASAGDVNGDGYADVVVGAFRYDNGQTDEGGAFVYHGSPSGLETSPASTIESDQEFASFGDPVATAGDVNGDGYSDVIVGAPFYDDGQPTQLEEGRAFVYHGSADGLETSAAWTADGNQLEAFFGSSAATAGDVNGDGYADVIVGANQYDNGQNNEGRVFVYNGSGAGLATSPAWMAEGNEAGASIGVSVATAGDVNGDGYADVIIGSTSAVFGRGRAFIYHGSSAGLPANASWMVTNSQVNTNYAASVATAGDVNGDGYADVILGSSSFIVGQETGRAFIFFGNGGRGLDLKPRLRNTTNAHPVAHLGVSDSSEGFRLNVLGRTPFGPGRVRLEAEVKPQGSPFDGLGTIVTPLWVDTGTAGVELGELASGLFDQAPYHWRVRLHYDPVTTPFVPRSRWMTAPWKGWQEPMVRTAAIGVGAGRVPDGTLRVTPAGAGMVTLNWDASCTPTDTDYAIYEGELRIFTSHEARFCGIAGTSMTFTPLPGNRYFLVVPLNATHEGSYGTTSGGAERPLGLSACLPREIAACP